MIYHDARLYRIVKEFIVSRIGVGWRGSRREYGVRMNG